MASIRTPATAKLPVIRLVLTYSVRTSRLSGGERVGPGSWKTTAAVAA